MKINSVAIEIIQRQTKITGRSLSKKIGIHPQSLSAMKKRGSTTRMNAALIARALGVDLAEILPKEPEQKGDEDNENSCH